MLVALHLKVKRKEMVSGDTMQKNGGWEESVQIQRT